MDKNKYLIEEYEYFRANPHDGEKINLNNKSELLKTKFDPTKPTRFAIHGWKGSYKAHSVQMIKDGVYNFEKLNN